MTTFKVGDVVRVATNTDLNYINSWSQQPITLNTQLVVRKIRAGCLYFKDVSVGSYPWRFLPGVDFSNKNLEDYL